MNFARGNARMKLSAVLIGAGCGWLLLELACQVLYAVVVVPRLEAQRNDPLHYYMASDDPALCYVLQPGYHMEKDGRSIWINLQGIRDDRDETDGPRKVALLGDSVVFGIALSQEQTPSAALQRMAGDGFRILNLGMPGYGLEELARYLELKLSVHKPEQIYYVLNLNDFSRRNTIYEGGDNGLFRIYAKPRLKSPFFFRKAVYRLAKGGHMSSVRWYRWMYEGNRNELLPIVKRMADFAKSNGSEFTVVLFPPAVAYEDGSFALQDVVDEIHLYLKSNGVPVIVPVREFGSRAQGLQDDTDHLTPSGSEVMAGVIGRDMGVE